jgi:hypothetical protein
MTITYLVAMADSHAGHKLGLCNPDVKLYDEKQDGTLTEYIPALTAYQEWLWNDVYIPACNYVARVAQNEQIVTLHEGDLTHGDGHVEELMSSRMNNQFRTAVANFDPLIIIPGMKALRLVFGTGIHEFGEGSSALTVMDQLKLMYPIDIKALYHGLGEIGNVTIDYSHHGPGAGNRSWLRGNVARFYLRDIIFEEIKAGRIPPDLTLRGHVHEYIHEVINEIIGENERQFRLVVIPSLCGLGDYGRKVTHSEYILRNGVVLFVIENGKIEDVIPLIRTLDLRTKETIL